MAVEEALTSASVPPTIAPSTTTRSNVLRAKRPGRRGGTHDERFDQLVEVPLVHEQLVEAVQALAHDRGGARPAHPHVVGDADPEQPERRAEQEAGDEQAVVFVHGLLRGARERRLEELVHTKSVRGICSSPTPTAPIASSAIAIRIGHSRSAIAWCGPGKPTSVSSSSPVSRVPRDVRVMQVPCFELARLRHGLAVERAEDHAERVQGREERADVAGGVERPVPAAAFARDQQDLVLREEAREGRDAGEREAADEEARVRERQRLAEAAHAVERLLAAPSRR